MNGHGGPVNVNGVRMDRIGFRFPAWQRSVAAAEYGWGRGFPTEEDVLDWLENHTPRATRRLLRIVSLGRRHPRRLGRAGITG